MKKTGLLAITGLAAMALFLGTLAPSHAQGQDGGGQGGGRQGRRGGGGGFGGGRQGFGRGGFGRGMGMDPTQSSKLMLIQRDDVRTELKISAKQREQIDEEQQKGMEAMRGNRPDFQALQDLTPEERRAKMQEFREQMQKQMATFTKDMNTKIAGILTPEQSKRLGELDLQFRGPLALGDKELADELKLSDEQKTQVNTIVADYRKAQQERMMNGFRRGGGGQGGDPGQRPSPEEMRARMEQMQKEGEKLRKESADKVVAALNDEQKQSWKTMQGKAFTFKVIQPGPPPQRGGGNGA